MSFLPQNICCIYDVIVYAAIFKSSIYINTFILSLPLSVLVALTNSGRVMHICISKLNIIGSDNGLSPNLRQAIT